MSTSVRIWVPTTERQPISRLTIDITDRQHQSLKAPAASQGKTIRQDALERLFPDDADGEQAWQALKTLLDTRIRNGLEGRVSDKRIDQVVDEELSKGGRA